MTDTNPMYSALERAAPSSAHGQSAHGQSAERSSSDRAPATRPPVSQSLLRDLIDELTLHPKGLRRWSVMRAMRTRRARAGHEITPKFEDDVERAFRRHCAGDSARGSAPALFNRPKDRTGEVWALDSQSASTFLGEAHEAA